MRPPPRPILPSWRRRSRRPRLGCGWRSRCSASGPSRSRTVRGVTPIFGKSEIALLTSRLPACCLLPPTRESYVLGSVLTKTETPAPSTVHFSGPAADTDGLLPDPVRVSIACAILHRRAERLFSEGPLPVLHAAVLEWADAELADAQGEGARASASGIRPGSGPVQRMLMQRVCAHSSWVCAECCFCVHFKLRHLMEHYGSWPFSSHPRRRVRGRDPRGAGGGAGVQRRCGGPGGPRRGAQVPGAANTRADRYGSSASALRQTTLAAPRGLLTHPAPLSARRWSRAPFPASKGPDAPRGLRGWCSRSHRRAGRRRRSPQQCASSQSGAPRSVRSRHRPNTPPSAPA